MLCLTKQYIAMKWTMKDGKEIDVMDMSDTHVANTLKMIMRTSNHRDLLNCILKGKEAYDLEYKRATKPSSFEPNGEMAQMMHDQMIDEEYGIMDDSPMYYGLHH